MRLEVRHLDCGYGTHAVARDVSLTVNGGEVVCLLGPNGSGKTTLFKTVLGLLRRLAGSITLDGSETSHWSQNRLAREIAYVPQSHTPLFPYRVLDVVVMGRAARLGLFAAPGRRDLELARAALDEAGIGHLAGRPYTEISGGERQMVLITRALVQEARLLVMDEPTSNLDFGNQVRVLRRMRDLAAGGIGILMTTHYPNHALICADRVAILHDGHMVAQGAPAEVITEQMLSAIYRVDTRIHRLGGGHESPALVCTPHLGAKRL
ncbi:MAG: ABC transporter ATP-binding protein [Candidatus Sumerlaeaceae bacterium]|nr:ABC transporter ATP-binding protein [Candidatus Sumerlaeaceae bacterium]